MDNRELNKVTAAAAFERGEADKAALAVESCRAKAERLRGQFEAAQADLREAQRQADEGSARADAAEHALAEAQKQFRVEMEGVSVVANAQTASAQVKPGGQ